jgi:hypothetical protein
MSSRQASRALTALGLVVFLLQAQLQGVSAMGSGNHFEDAQVGLDYVVYQPLSTAGMTLKDFTLVPCNNSHDEAVLAHYAAAGKTLTLVERSQTYSCSYSPKAAAGQSVQTITKPGSGMLTASKITFIWRGLKPTEIKAIESSLSTKYPRPKQ